MKRVLATLLLMAAGIAVAQTKSAAPWVVPPKAAAKQNPLKDKPETAEGGKKIFKRSCVTCHGDESHARTNNAPDLASEAVQTDTDGALFWRISNGNSRTGMPSFSGLPEPQRWQLVMYIRSLKK